MKMKTGNTMRALLSSLLILSFFSFADGKEPFWDFFDMLESNRIDEAEAYISSVNKDSLRNFLEGILSFYKGEYLKAVEKIQRAQIKERDLGFYPELISRTYMATKDALTVETEHFSVRIVSEEDSILTHYIGDALEEIYRDVGKIFNFYPEKVRIEIYGDKKTFSDVTTLKEIEIITTGTVGVCKFNKIMVLTPRIFLQGYPWVNVLRHEYIHYVITYLTKNRTPVWLQEAIAKYFDGEGLSPSMLYLLKRGIEENKLIDIEKMHPSIAKLPSAEAAGLAFAEVYTMMDLFIKKIGKEGLIKVLDMIENGMDAVKAFETVLNTDFDSFFMEWKEYAKSIAQNAPPVEMEKMVFKDEKIEEKKGKHYVLGDLLLERGKIEEAIFEYEREINKNKSSIILNNKLSFLYLQTGKFKEALQLAESTLKDYPFNYTANLNKAKALLAMGNYESAFLWLKKALYINPFDPDLHAQLEKVYSKTSNPLFEREKEVKNFLEKR